VKGAKLKKEVLNMNLNYCLKREGCSSMSFNKIWGFLKVRKRWWLIPLMIIVFMGILIILGQGNNLPFVYDTLW